MINANDASELSMKRISELKKEIDTSEIESLINESISKGLRFAVKIFYRNDSMMEVYQALLEDYGYITRKEIINQYKIRLEFSW